MKDPYKNLIPKLTPGEIKNLVKLLPEPCEKVALGKHNPIHFEIYLVKKMHRRQWENRALLKLLLEARRSYHIYSELPPLDSYDPKSQIYLARARYNLQEEWVSTRFIPYHGDPPKFRDLEMFEYRGRAIEYWIKKRLLDPAKLDWHSVVGASGLCGIEPHPDSMRYTSLAFALIVRQFFKTCRQYSFKYVLLQAAEEFVQRVLTFRTQNKVFPPGFTLASDILMMKGANPIRLIRNNQLIYNRPFYFFNRKAVRELLSNFIRQKVLTAKTFEYYIGDASLPNKLLNNERTAVSEFAKLGKIFNADGLIYGAKISGAKLRDILKKVPDGPQLRIMRFTDFISNLQKMIDAAEAAMAKY